jgi:hypothetical protein
VAGRRAYKDAIDLDPDAALSDLDWFHKNCAKEFAIFQAEFDAEMARYRGTGSRATRRGQPLSLKVEHVPMICAQARQFVRPLAAFRVYGYPPQTVNAWLKEGNDPDGRPLFKALVKCLGTAEAVLESASTIALAQMAKNGNSALMERLMARRFPAYWGQTARTPVGGAGDGTLSLDAVPGLAAVLGALIEEVPPEKREAARQKVAALLSSKGSGGG